MSDIDKPLPNDTPNVTLTIRMIMSGKEVGSIIGKGGEIINNIREESGAKIHISDGSVPERIVTVTGSTDAILKAFNLIAKKFEEDGPEKNGENSGKSSSASNSSKSNGSGSSLKLIVPASQCGSLIGKGGAKIKEIREVTGASVQVASELLPNSTERTVTIGGSRNSITQCVYQICCVMLEFPPKGTTIPYTPKAGLLSSNNSGGRGGNRGGGGSDNPLASLLSLGGGASTLAAIASLAGSQIRDNRRNSDRDHDRGGSSSTSFEIYVPNDMIGCIIGKGGSKIAEIRQISGAMIRISKSDGDPSATGSSAASGGGGANNSDNNSGRGTESSSASERQITITGNADSVALAKSLINMSLDLHKSKMEEQSNNGSASGGGSSSGNGSGSTREREPRESRDRERYHHGGGGGGAAGSNNVLAAAQLLAKPEALTTALTTLASLSSLGSLGGGLLAGLGGSGSGSGHVTGVHRRGGGNYSSGSRSRDDSDRGSSRDSKRSKFAPY